MIRICLCYTITYMISLRWYICRCIIFSFSKFQEDIWLNWWNRKKNHNNIFNLSHQHGYEFVEVKGLSFDNLSKCCIINLLAKSVLVTILHAWPKFRYELTAGWRYVILHYRSYLISQKIGGLPTDLLSLRSTGVTSPNPDSYNLL